MVPSRNTGAGKVPGSSMNKLSNPFESTRENEKEEANKIGSQVTQGLVLGERGGGSMPGGVCEG